MRQVLAIFRKDVRRQWPRLAGALALTVLTGCVDSPDPAGGIANLLYLVWTACWVYIGASVIQQESLPGDRQYWLTRPYDWRKLLAAKVLFIILFAALPLIATKAAVLWANGTPPLRYAPAILSRSLAFTGAVGLLAGALAAVTGTLTQFLWGFLALAGLEAAAIALGVNYGGDWGAVAWIRSAMVEMLIAAAGVAVLLLQYRRRRTFVSRAILSVTALLVAVCPVRKRLARCVASRKRTPPGRRLRVTSRSRCHSTLRLGRRSGTARRPYFPALAGKGSIFRFA